MYVSLSSFDLCSLGNVYVRVYDRYGYVITLSTLCRSYHSDGHVTSDGIYITDKNK